MSDHFNPRMMVLGPISYLLGTKIHTEFEVTNEGILATERLQNDLNLPIRSPPRDTWQHEVRTMFQALLTTNHRTREAANPRKLTPIRTLLNASAHRPMLLTFWVMNRAYDPQIPNHDTCQMTRFPILTPDRNISVDTYNTIVANMASEDPRVTELVSLEMVEARKLYEHLGSTYKISKAKIL